MKKHQRLFLAKTTSIFGVLFFLFSPTFFQAQQETRNEKSVPVREMAAKHKVLIIPFEPHLYNSEIDRFINAETKFTAKEIRHKFRDGLNEQIYKALRASNYGALDLMSDTLLYRQNLHSIYQVTGYDYLKVPDQTKYKAPQKEKEQKKIDKGQLVVETNAEEKFMDARPNSPALIAKLAKDFKSDIFIFINELDIRASGSKEPGEIGAGSDNRRIVVHYTIFDKNGTEINSGTVEEEFDPSINQPNRIISKNFSKIAIILAQRLNKALAAPTR